MSETADRAPARRGLIERLLLAQASAPVSAAAIALSVIASWALAWILGGVGNAAPHWFYIPVILAGLRFGPAGAAVVAVVATVVAGPLLPLNVGTAEPQLLSDWLSRGLFFLLLGQFITLLFGQVRRVSRERGLVEGQRIRAIQDASTSASERRLRSLVQCATDMITVSARDGSILYDSPAVERILGWRQEQRLGVRSVEFMHPDDREMLLMFRAGVIGGQGPSRVLEIRMSDSRGAWHWIEGTATNMFDEPTVGGMVVNYRIIDDRKVLEKQLTHRASHDTLTNLANRALFRDRVAVALERAGSRGRRPAVLFIDVDDFKTINDGLGHAAGDELLVGIAERLMSCVRPGDTVSRLGGDEFAILIVEGGDPAVTAIGVADRVIRRMRDSFTLVEREVVVDVSIGIASNEGDDVLDTECLLRRADIAMYRAKAHGKARFEVFSEEMEEMVRRQLDERHGRLTATVLDAAS